MTASTNIPKNPLLSEATTGAVLVLTEVLAEICAAEKDGDGELGAFRASLAAVLNFVEQHIAPDQLILLRPLRKLELALRDTAKGAQPPVFFSPRTKDDKPRTSGPRKDRSIHALHGAVAAAVDILIKQGGKSRDEAAQFVATLLSSEQIKDPSGARYRKNQILTWRAEMGARSPAIAKTIYDSMLSKHHPRKENLKLSGKWPPEAARKVVRGIVVALRERGF